MTKQNDATRGGRTTTTITETREGEQRSRSTTPERPTPRNIIRDRSPEGRRLTDNPAEQSRLPDSPRARADLLARTALERQRTNNFERDLNNPQLRQALQALQPNLESITNLSLSIAEDRNNQHLTLSNTTVRGMQNNRENLEAVNELINTQAGNNPHMAEALRQAFSNSEGGDIHGPAHDNYEQTYIRASNAIIHQHERQNEPTNRLVERFNTTVEHFNTALSQFSSLDQLHQQRLEPAPTVSVDRYQLTRAVSLAPYDSIQTHLNLTLETMRTNRDRNSEIIRHVRQQTEIMRQLISDTSTFINSNPGLLTETSSRHNVRDNGEPGPSSGRNTQLNDVATPKPQDKREHSPETKPDTTRDDKGKRPRLDE